MKLLRSLAAACLLAVSAFASQTSWVSLPAGAITVHKQFNFESFAETGSGGGYVGARNIYTTQITPRARNAADETVLEVLTVFCYGSGFPRYLQEFFSGSVYIPPTGGVDTGDTQTETFYGHLDNSGSLQITSRLVVYRRNGGVIGASSFSQSGPGLVSAYQAKSLFGGIRSYKYQYPSSISGAPAGNVTKTSVEQKDYVDISKTGSDSWHLAAFGYNTGENTPNANQNVLMQITDLGVFNWSDQDVPVLCPPLAWPALGVVAEYDFGSYEIKKAVAI